MPNLKVENIIVNMCAQIIPQSNEIEYRHMACAAAFICGVVVMCLAICNVMLNQQLWHVDACNIRLYLHAAPLGLTSYVTETLSSFSSRPFTMSSISTFLIN